MAAWRSVPDIAWVVDEPHAYFARRELRTYGMCGYWDLSTPCVREDGSTWLLPGVQRSVVDVFGDRHTAVLRDTARVVMPHLRFSRLEDGATRNVAICLESSPLQAVSVRALGQSRGDISMRGLLALLTPMHSTDLEFGSSFDARCQRTYHSQVSAHRANSVFFHEHQAGLPPYLMLVLSVQYGAHPARRNADFANETVAAILLDDGGPAPGSVFCDTARFSDDMLAFVGSALQESAAYRAFCWEHLKDARVRLVDSDTSESVALPQGQALSDEAFKSLAEQLEARDRQERESERERWRVRLREITGLLDERSRS